jgi:hypothetical protein
LDGRRVRTAVYGVFVAFAAAFVMLSLRGIIRGVFGTDAAPVAAVPVAAGNCADRIAQAARALDRGVAAAAVARTEADALARFRGALSPDWDHEGDLAEACDGLPHGADARAALLRLRRVEEGAVGRSAVDTGPARAELEAYLPR